MLGKAYVPKSTVPLKFFFSLILTNLRSRTFGYIGYEMQHMKKRGYKKKGCQKVGGRMSKGESSCFFFVSGIRGNPFLGLRKDFHGTLLGDILGILRHFAFLPQTRDENNSFPHA